MQEQFAREENVTGRKAKQCGFVVHPKCPWLRYFADGIVFGANGPELLLEIKCLCKGKTKIINDYLNFCSFLEKDYTLKKKHSYYGQIQLGLLILNIWSCYFVLYLFFDKFMYILKIPYNENYAIDMLTNVRYVYMSKMLHYFCKENKENRTLNN